MSPKKILNADLFNLPNKHTHKEMIFIRLYSVVRQTHTPASSTFPSNVGTGRRTKPECEPSIHRVKSSKHQRNAPFELNNKSPLTVQCVFRSWTKRSIRQRYLQFPTNSPTIFGGCVFTSYYQDIAIIAKEKSSPKNCKRSPRIF